ncbi:type III-A CRISPR-associated protein Csm2 [Thermodesulfobacterium sp. TA1]|uniref:type III-A CRISPR-associated protein Csm2 n=1 Tax=Thermodesulfobacterium sp. TA1 TaxID=2234087 RepID=UPI001232CD0F|nr:type III-A CRISPR-associated protein Csm2 [Thermodesulfobacterium sp. TA1]QER42718.1 type III-A CRISPR-associated protein Csm2 [Thermodesulfobacterium sp. TA1]
MTQSKFRNNQSFNQRQNLDRRQQENTQPLPEIKFWENKKEGLVNPLLFSDIAYQCSEIISKDTKRNKRSQLRKFYDEILLFYDRLKVTKESFPQFLPYIKLLRAKAYYSLGRKHINDAFKDMIEKCLNQIETWEDFEVFKNFFEAFMGFYRYHRKDD